MSDRKIKMDTGLGEVRPIFLENQKQSFFSSCSAFGSKIKTYIQIWGAKNIRTTAQDTLDAYMPDVAPETHLEALFTKWISTSQAYDLALAQKFEPLKSVEKTPGKHQHQADLSTKNMTSLPLPSIHCSQLALNSRLSFFKSEDVSAKECLSMTHLVVASAVIGLAGYYACSS